MKKRRLGPSDLYVSELGLGCMSLGTNAQQAERIIGAALDEGINYFDTADLYDFGVNEQLVGQALKNVRDKVILATKVGNRWKEAKDSWNWDPSKAYIKEAVKQSLSRLGTDYIDLYQLHGGTMDDPLDETIEAFEELKSEGLIRYYGISSIRPNVIREFANRSGMVSVMMQYSMLDRRPEEEALPFLQSKNISVVTRGPLAKGLVSRTGLKKATAKIQEAGYLDYRYEELEDVIHSLEERFTSNRDLTSLALLYNLTQPAVASVITGASTVEQIQENARAIQSQPLSEEERSFIQSVTKANQYDQHR
ncbi:aldo/keto reductase [Cytobacillus spongiae]|jgi:aryl-alcohol dehydrogenase-like predicted oxidoreductase|uniref:aldo/keto reductase n=1 Tax=Cytobacillus spongiae TaxID=2901381 RepID=UPI001F18C9A4|nr:aldo/keto reductase [Cytobacillus spongiae]UII54719.1 aldo/keto reductase [Cytobacillus spongiae]